MAQIFVVGNVKKNTEKNLNGLFKVKLKKFYTKFINKK